mmetsp:Transcript_32316/g.76965  ORF Transcript_32316/g.76965 Transcript_32316/m.76965 type:complete len:342 (+) Transcript_32316:196-1221(+)
MHFLRLRRSAPPPRGVLDHTLAAVASPPPGRPRRLTGVPRGGRQRSGSLSTSPPSALRATTWPSGSVSHAWLPRKPMTRRGAAASHEATARHSEYAGGALGSIAGGGSPSRLQVASQRELPDACSCARRRSTSWLAGRWRTSAPRTARSSSSTSHSTSSPPAGAAVSRATPGASPLPGAGSAARKTAAPAGPRPLTSSSAPPAPMVTLSTEARGAGVRSIAGEAAAASSARPDAVRAVTAGIARSCAWVPSPVRRVTSTQPASALIPSSRGGASPAPKSVICRARTHCPSARVAPGEPGSSPASTTHTLAPSEKAETLPTPTGLPTAVGSASSLEVSTGGS